MKNLHYSEFLQWAETKGIAFDPAYPRSGTLSYVENQDSRFWVTPKQPEQQPFFIASLLELLGDWQWCRAWRSKGSWPSPAHIDPDDFNELVEMTILRGLGLPLGTTDAVEFERGELSQLITLLFTTTVFGWSVAEDLYVVPDHGREFLKCSHDDVVHAIFRDANDVQSWVQKMSKRGFDLPTEPPDGTFKRPAWMMPSPAE